MLPLNQTLSVIPNLLQGLVGDRVYGSPKEINQGIDSVINRVQKMTMLSEIKKILPRDEWESFDITNEVKQIREKFVSFRTKESNWSLVFVCTIPTLLISIILTAFLVHSCVFIVMFTPLCFALMVTSGIKSTDHQRQCFKLIVDNFAKLLWELRNRTASEEEINETLNNVAASPYELYYLDPSYVAPLNKWVSEQYNPETFWENYNQQEVV